MRKIRVFSPESIDVPRRPGAPDPQRETIEVMESVQVEVLHRRAPDMPVRMVEGDYEADLAGVVNARMALEAQREGFDAVAIHCYNEPGANAAKEVCDIPVVSSPAASMAVASILGNKFSIIIALGGGKGKEAGGMGRTALLDIVKHYGLEQKLASIRAIDLPPPSFNEDIVTEQDIDQLRTAVLDEAVSAVKDDGADVIISYGGPKVNEYVQKKLPEVPIVDSHGCTIIMAEVLVRLGLTHSKKAYPKPRELFKYYLRKE